MGRRDIFDILLITFVLAIIVSFCSPARAEDESLCARVKMEIQQELTFERQAFDARMRINNGLSNITLENVSIQLDFADEDGKEVFGSSDPNDNDAIFFYRLESLKNIDDISGNGTVNPESTAEIHWLIIPAPGAAKDMPQGAMYLVGATVTYLLGGEEHKTIVAPDYIYVRPMPELFLDYFLPGDVYGDDPFTSETEPPIPFSLGVRVKNAGSGEAYEVKIDSAQPKIVSNQQGLPVHYKILSSEVNGEITDTELTVDFGQIDPGKSATARWIMSCDISGRFVDFTAYYSHSDELGGQLTSLITGTATHKLIHDVLVDLPGRDSVRDFLALDEEASYKVYESENVDTEVHDQSTLASLQQVSDNEYLLSTPVTDGFMYVKLTDPYGGTKIISEVIRSDGKKIKEENVWLSRHKVGSNPWEYYFNLFDYNSTGSYRVVFKDASVELNPPVLQFIPDKHGAEEHTISFVVQASDPDGTIPSLFAAPLPVGATFTDNGNGEGTFEWTPVIGQAGDYEITFTASDGILEASQLVKIRICHHTDTDCDGMDDQWEMEHFNTLGRDGTDDYDHDGISDLKEFLYGFDPLVPEFAPSVPEISEPLDGAEVTTRTPTLTVKNSIDPDGDEIKYQFELYSDKDYRTLVDSAEIDETDSTTSWDVTTELNDNTWYFWRVRATDGKSFSLWTYGKFFVNTQNDPPGKFNISWPANDSVITTETPTIEITNSTDPDGDRISYTFEVYTQDDSSNPVTSETVNENENGKTTWQVPVSLENGSAYFVKVTATDTHGEVSEADQVNFSINTDEHAPTSPVILEPEAGTEIIGQELDLVVGNATDEDNDSLNYYFELDKVPTFDSSDLIQSGAIPEQAEETIWHASNLEDNSVYYWRVKASDGSSESYWSYGSFRVNTKNDNPLVPVVKNPGQNAWVNTLSPALELHPGKDLDEDQLTYQIELYSDRKLRNLISQVESSSPVWNLPVKLEDTTWYFWRARVIDEHGVSSDWTDTYRFFVRRVNQPPEITILEPQADIYTNEASVTISWEDEDPDSNATISLYYNTQPVTEGGILIADGIEENPDGEADTYTWNIENLAEGKYYIYAVISDEFSSVKALAPGSITIDRTPPEVTAEPAGGGYYESVTVTLSSNEEADIYYTLDGSDPTPESEKFTGTGIEITEDTTLKFIGIDLAGNQSEVYSEIYTITHNRPPNEPSGPVPDNGSTDVSVHLKLSWQGSDPDPGDTVLYDLYLGTQSNPETKIAENLTSSSYEITTLEYSTQYWWKVVAKDNHGASTESPVWSFSTFSADADSDGDGLTNEEEINLGTDPFKTDTDADGFSDKEEVEWGSDPTNPNSVPNIACEADLNFDGVVDGLDLAIFSSGYGGSQMRADLNEDGVVDNTDVRIFAEDYGRDACPETLAGDLNGDDQINEEDFDIFLDTLGKCDGDSGFNDGADLDKDGCVTNLDYVLWYRTYIKSNRDGLGDLNGDGNIDDSDLYLFQESLGSCAGDANFKLKADYDGDGCITNADYAQWYQDYNSN